MALAHKKQETKQLIKCNENTSMIVSYVLLTTFVVGDPTGTYIVWLGLNGKAAAILGMAGYTWSLERPAKSLGLHVTDAEHQ